MNNLLHDQRLYKVP